MKNFLFVVFFMICMGVLSGQKFQIPQANFLEENAPKPKLLILARANPAFHSPKFAGHSTH